VRQEGPPSTRCSPRSKTRSRITSARSGSCRTCPQSLSFCWS
jgi:hypothetical protein